MIRLTPEEYHVPVMLHECMLYLKPHAGGTYIDATLGGGGHTASVLAALMADTHHSLNIEHSFVVSFDADEMAIDHCTRRFAEILNSDGTGVSLRLVHANFESMPEYLYSEMGINPSSPGVSGILFDLGVSSYQFDHHERGFSFRTESVLDMRFTPEGETAADVLNNRKMDELIEIFKAYADEPRARQLAHAVVRRRMIAPFRRVTDVRDVIIQNIPPHHQAKTLTRIFQALRIEVNREFTRLRTALREIVPLMEIGGRIVVLSYHSGEDRIIKDVYKEFEKNDSPRLKIVTKKPIVPSEAELQINPRARSARLRCAERFA